MDKYSLLAVSTILVLALFLTFSPMQDAEVDYDYIGMISDINKSTNGYTFVLNTENETIKCYYQEMPNESLYRISGEFSENGKMFFVSSMSEVE